MAIDLTGGLSDDREYVFAAQPDDPEMRESVNAWIWDKGSEFGLPRLERGVHLGRTRVREAFEVFEAVRIPLR